MESRADAFLAIPGGWGTLEELLEILTVAHLDILRKPIVIFNQDGYCDELPALFDRIVRGGFMHETIRRKFNAAGTVEEIFPLLEDRSCRSDEKKRFQTKGRGLCESQWMPISIA